MGGIHGAGAESVGHAQRFHALFTRSRHLDQRHFALDAGLFRGPVGDLAHRHDAVELRLDLLDHRRGARGDDSDARRARRRIHFGHRQAFDIVAAPGKQPNDTRQHTGLIVYQHRDGVAFDSLRTHQTSIFPASLTSPPSSGPSSISLWAAPDGIIG